LQTFPIPLENPLWMLLQSFGSPRINSRAGKKAHLSGPIDELRASIFPFGGLGGEVRLTPWRVNPPSLNSLNLRPA